MDTETAVWTLSVDAGQQMWDAIATVRDASPRLAGDASTDDIVDALAPLIEQQVRKAQAAELRSMAAALRSTALELDQEGMLSASEQNVYARNIRAVRDRANELDPT